MSKTNGSSVVADWRPFEVAGQGDAWHVIGRRGDEIWSIIRSIGRAEADDIAALLNGPAIPLGPPLSKSQFEAFCQTLYLADGRRLAPAGIFMSARVDEWQYWASAVPAPKARAAFAAELRRIADAVEAYPDLLHNHAGGRE